MFKWKKAEELTEEVEESVEEVCEKPKELSPSEIKVLKRLSFLNHYMEEMKHSVLQGKITKAEYEEEVNEIGKKLETIETFDDMLGSPFLSFPQIFGEDAYDKMVHDAIEDCYESGDAEAETD